MTSESHICDKCGHDCLSEEGLKNHKIEMSDAHDFVHDQHDNTLTSESIHDQHDNTLTSESIHDQHDNTLTSESHICDKCGHDCLSEEGLKNHKIEMSDAHDFVHDKK